MCVCVCICIYLCMHVYACICIHILIATSINLSRPHTLYFGLINKIWNENHIPYVREKLFYVLLAGISVKRRKRMLEIYGIHMMLTMQ